MLFSPLPMALMPWSNKLLYLFLPSSGDPKDSDNDEEDD
jgi:hypothetical protein